MPSHPFQDYRPLAKVRLVIRFEEFASTPSAVPPKKPATLRKGAKDTGNELEYVVDGNAPDGVKRYILQSKGGKSKVSDTSKDELTQPIDAIVPNEAQLERNGIREADTLRLSIPFIDLPFDPRLIRSCAVEYYLGTISPTEWADAMGRNTIPVLPYSSEYGSNLRFQGWVDTWDVSWDTSKGAIAELNCRDNTQLFIDQTAPPQLKIDVKLPIHKAIAKYLASFPQYEGIAVEYRPAGESAPRLDSVMQAGVAKGGGQGPGKEKTSVWDYITDLAGRVGCIALVDTSPTVFESRLLEGGQVVIVIQKARTLLASKGARDGDPYRPRQIDGLVTARRTLIYGRNVDDLKLTRKFNENAPTNIEVACYLPERKKTITARFPGVTTKVQPGEAADKKVIVWRVEGVNTRESLMFIAQNLYEQISRQELAASFKTTSLGSYGGDNSTPDLLWVQAGDPIDVLFAMEAGGQDSPGVVPQSIEKTALDDAKMKDYLMALGYDRHLASVYAELYRAKGFQTTFRVSKVSLAWSSEDGVSISISATNYVEIRMDKEVTKT